MKKLKHIKLFENFINALSSEEMESIQADVSHIIEYSDYKYGKLYAGQNSNFNQKMTPIDKNSPEEKRDLLGQSKIDVQYFIGSDDGKRLTCYNPGRSANKDGYFLGAFNRRFKTNYRTMQKRNKDGSEIGDLTFLD
jgi:hypothetical protein